MGYARIRPELHSPLVANQWTFAGLQDLEGNELYWTPETEWVKAVCFDAMESGLYVLTEDDDFYFTCHSADLEYSDTLPTPLYPRPQIATEKKDETMHTLSAPQPKQGKHALPYNVHRDIEQADFNALVEQLGQDLDTWQLIARDLARDITRNEKVSDDSFSFAYDILNRLSEMPEMGIHPSEVRPRA